MKFPKRPKPHIVETESFRLLQSLAPKEWIVRGPSERDYGIDLYIELVSKDAELTGQLMAIQIKAQKNIKWKPSDGVHRVSRSPSVKTTTATYWLNHSVPVFLFVADLSAQNIYFVAVQEEVRTKFDKLNSQNNISFKLSDRLDLTSEKGLAQLQWFYDRESLHEQFVFHITNLINQVEVFGDFIRINQNRDVFMDVEAAQHLQFRALHEACRMASLYLEQEWNVEPLSELYARDREEWKDRYCYLHEKTLDYALQKIEKLFPALVRRAMDLITDVQASYWQQKDPIFFDLCYGELAWTLKRIENEADR